MKIIWPVIALAFTLSVAHSQPATLEVKGVFGECHPVYAAVTDELTLYAEPDLRSETIRVPYREGWRVPAPRSEGLTRVLQLGALEVIEPDPSIYCRVPPTEGPTALLIGEVVEYLYYVGEGFGEIRVRGGQCQAEVVEDLGHFRTLELPDVQVWFRVFFADGSSPGWLFFDGSQVRVADVLC